MTGRLRTPRCELVAIGTELTSGYRTDSNTLWLRQRLGALDLTITRVQVIPDDDEELRDTLRGALARADLVVTTGGLGPTEDDRTLAALCDVLDRPAHRNAETDARIRAQTTRHHREVSPEVARMAMVPTGAEVLTNERGAAPGILVKEGDSWLVALPGVPAEMKGIFNEELRPRLEARFGPCRAVRCTVRVAGVWESEADRRAAPLCQAHGTELTTLTDDGTVDLHMHGDSDAVKRACEALTREFGDDVVSTDGRRLAEVVLDEARQRSGTLSVAESCTGGRVAAALTAVPGASTVFHHAHVTYADQAKIDVLKVPAAVLGRDGAVSEAAVRAMLAGLFRQGTCRWGLAVSGIAGPSGGTPDRPVGTIWFAAGDADWVRCRRVLLRGERGQIQATAAGLALDQLRRAIVGQAGGDRATEGAVETAGENHS